MSDDTSVKFETGELRMTPLAAAVLRAAGESLGPHLSCHARGEWGEVPQEVREENERALQEGGALLSAHPAKSGAMVCILTSGDRSVSAVFLFAELQEVLR